MPHQHNGQQPDSSFFHCFVPFSPAEAPRDDLYVWYILLNLGKNAKQKKRRAIVDPARGNQSAKRGADRAWEKLLDVVIRSRVRVWLQGACVADANSSLLRLDSGTNVLGISTVLA